MISKFIILREISRLSFNARILQEAGDPRVPLKEKIRFLGIHSNNMDEFFRVRFSALKKMIQGKKRRSKILDQIQTIVLKQQEDFNRIWKKILAELKKKKVFLVDHKHLNAEQKTFVINLFDQEIRSSIIPVFIENMTEMPSYGDKNIFLGIMMRKDNDQRYAIIDIPTESHKRFVLLPSKTGEQHWMLLEDLVRFNLPRIFSYLGYTDFEAHMFKVTKDAEITLDNDISTTFIQKIEKGIKNRKKAQAIRFQYDREMNLGLLETLIRKLKLSNRDSIIPSGPIRNFRDFIDFPANLPTSQPLTPFIHPSLHKGLVSEVILKRDVLLYCPYHSFVSIIDLLREAAMDDQVKSIKITAYRLAPHSKIVNALINAARNGKKVHVILELRAYDDEEANLKWKAELEEAGVKVFVGPPDFKVHAKLCVIKKQKGKRSIHYGIIGTGNFNELTASCYSDHFLLTSKRDIMSDLNKIFKALENPQAHWNQLGACKTLLVSPTTMRKELNSLINAEKQGEMIIDVNALSDEKLIKKLLKAKSTRIKLLVRSILCAPLPAISIVDHFLEHSRIWFFHHGGQEKTYISSADWMLRNLNYRVEVAVPIRDNALKKELKDILHIKLNDNVKARMLDSNEYVKGGKMKVRSQLAIYNYLKGKDYETRRH